MKFIDEINQINIPVFITARMGSTRLPGKHLLDIGGKPVIEQMISRIKNAKYPRFIVLCTTILPEDDILVDVAKRCNIKVFRGDPTDILKRWLDAADYYNVKFFISAEADDVFCDPEFIDIILLELNKGIYDYIACKGLPFGVTPTGINVEALRKVCSLKKESDTEGQERFFTKTGLFKINYIEVTDPDLINTDARMTLDYPDDYEFFKKIYLLMGKDKDYFSLREILNLLKENPELVKINNEMQTIYEQRYNEKYGLVDLN